KLETISTTIFTSILLAGTTLTQLNLAAAFDLPQSVTNAVLENASSESGLPISELKIVSAEQVTWPNGCMGLGGLDTICTQALVDGWIVTVGRDQQQWVYHTTSSRVLLASSENPNSIINRPPFDPGTSQENPLLPKITEPNRWVFQEVPSGRWFDPPTAYGFQYQMTSDSLFTNILDFPTGIDDDNLFTVSVGETIIGQFSPGQSVDFVSLLGNGVSEFTLTEINPLVDPKDPTAFPLQLAFNTTTASFQMEALTKPESVPEPASLLGIFALGAWGIGSLHRRTQHSR
ncbi:MAG: PEP-CTERM sorting domain-containing protein, partial [Symploca sp. SIO1A3]|nr:PEP-CTERM sorting domain-containing protein [Symploca sp. SIO1A3]